MTKPTPLPTLEDAQGGRRSIPLRGHTLLCLQGFRGLGYSAAFVDNLAALHRALHDDPDRLVTVMEGPDAVCGACPHHVGAGCTLNGEGSEAAIQEQDRLVLARLGLKAGDDLPWRAILARIASAIDGSDLPRICGNCRWLSLGYCRSGIEGLRKDATLLSQPAVGRRGPA